MKFKEILAAVCVILVIPMLWVCQGIGLLNMPEGVIGATILQWGLILQYYFRKKEPTP